MNPEGSAQSSDSKYPTFVATASCAPAITKKCECMCILRMPSDELNQEADGRGPNHNLFDHYEARCPTGKQIAKRLKSETDG